MESNLSPTQAHVFEQLAAHKSQRPTFSNALSGQLHSALVGEMERYKPFDGLYLSKHLLSTLHSCQRRYLAERDIPFAWNIWTARGTVSHKAIEFGIAFPDAAPLDLARHALTWFEQNNETLGSWLLSLPEPERMEFVSHLNSTVAAFFEIFPPIPPQWYPKMESASAVPFFEGDLVLGGKTDLTLGRASGTTAGKVIIDYKTGQFHPQHREDLRFYALVDTLRVGVPPRALATVYLDAGNIHVEDVDEDHLWVALRRVVDAVHIWDLLRHGTPPTTAPDNACNWCSERETCEAGQEFLRLRATI